MANYEDEICEDCMYFKTDKCDDNGKVAEKHQACRWFKSK